MGIASVSPSGCVTAATNYHTPFTVGKGGHAHGRGALLPLSRLRKRCSGSTMTCSMRGGLSTPSLPLHGVVSGACPAPASSPDNAAAGIGIAEFLVGKNLLVTGGTGFLAKVLIEKILRASPGVGKIYVVIKAKDTEASSKRLQNEVVDTELFKRLQEIHGKDYHGFVAGKLVPVAGNVTEANLGVAPKLADEIVDEVDIIVNSAASTTFDERYDVAMNLNTLGPFRLMSFAHRFRKLQLFLQVSTAYVNGQRQGVVPEKPFRLGDTIANELVPGDSSQKKSGAVLDIEAETKLAFNSRRDSEDSASFTRRIKCLGLERAKLHGWQDTYVFTKAMGEMVVNCMRGEIPVVTIRPSIIESTLREPFPGRGAVAGRGEHARKGDGSTNTVACSAKIPERSLDAPTG
ncbi:fatty acyl-CoA reductase 2-like [Panicum miliaceum]|uniref:Fatty acyl-CoA reductase n=1 Tax=Panicum miliaceum TaxID=4540 RepID=A0A3L6QIZ4_PANMI|nr:fatty acyl-CoA reductase 2-like [Panicum miliaceum]